MVLWLSLHAQAQVPADRQAKVDSLEQVVLQADTDTLKVKALMEQFALLAPFDTEATELLQLQVLAICDSAIQQNGPDKEFFLSSRARTHGALGVTYYMVAKHIEAQEQELAALKDYEALDERFPMARCYVILGAIMKEEGDLEAAMDYHQQARRLSEETNNTATLALALNNIGTVYFDQDSLRQSEQAFQATLELYKTLNQERGQGVAYLNLGRVKSMAKKPEEALEYFKQSLQIREAINDRQGLIYSHARLGDTYLELRQLDKARFHALKSLELAQEKGYPRGLRDANELLSKVYEQEGNTSAALAAYKQFIVARDSMLNEENIRAITQAEYTYKYEAELMADSIQNAEAQKAIKAELALQESENKQRTLLAWVLSLGLVVTLLLGYGLFQRYRKVQAQRQTIEMQKAQVEKALDELSQREEEKALLLKEIHHRVKNNLQVVSSLLDLQSMDLDNQEALAAVTDGQNRVKAMALIHEKLYQNEDIVRLDFEDYVGQLMKQTAAIFPGKGGVTQVVNARNIELDIDTAVPLGLILSELLTNAYKYAFPDGSGELEVSLTETEPGKYSMIVRDNGPGLPPDFDFRKAKSLGLKLVRRLSRQLYGQAVYKNDGGSCFDITFLDTSLRKATS